MAGSKQEKLGCNESDQLTMCKKDHTTSSTL